MASGPFPNEVYARIANYISRADLRSFALACNALASVAVSEVRRRPLLLNQAKPEYLDRSLDLRLNDDALIYQTTEIKIRGNPCAPIHAERLILPSVPDQWLNLAVLASFNNLKRLSFRNVHMGKGTPRLLGGLLAEYCPDLQVFEMVDMQTESKWDGFSLKRGLQKIAWASRHHCLPLDFVMESSATLTELSVDFYHCPATHFHDFSFFCSTPFERLEVLHIVPPYDDVAFDAEGIEVVSDEEGEDADPVDMNSLHAPGTLVRFLIRNPTIRSLSLGHKDTVESGNGKLNGQLLRPNHCAPESVLPNLTTLQTTIYNISIIARSNDTILKDLKTLRILPSEPSDTNMSLLEVMFVDLGRSGPFKALETLEFVTKPPFQAFDEDFEGRHVPRHVKWMGTLGGLFPEVKRLRIDPPTAAFLATIATMASMFPKLGVLEILTIEQDRWEDAEERRELEEFLRERAPGVWSLQYITRRK